MDSIKIKVCSQLVYVQSTLGANSLDLCFCKLKVSIVLQVFKNGLRTNRFKTDTAFRNYDNMSIDVLFVSYNGQNTVHVF